MLQALFWVITPGRPSAPSTALSLPCESAREPRITVALATAIAQERALSSDGKCAIDVTAAPAARPPPSAALRANGSRNSRSRGFRSAPRGPRACPRQQGRPPLAESPADFGGERVAEPVEYG